jgi:hypothetical protein
MQVSACDPAVPELHSGQLRQLGIENGRCASLTIAGNAVADPFAEIPRQATDAIN